MTTFPIAFQRENQILITYRDNFIQAWNFPGETKQFANQYRAGGLEVSPDGKLLAIFGAADLSGTVRLVNAETGRVFGDCFQPVPESRPRGSVSDSRPTARGWWSRVESD